MVIYNAKVVTLDKSTQHASAVAVKDGRVVAVGEFDDISMLIGERTLKIDAGGNTVLPGFIDSHIHLGALGFSLAYVDLRDADSISVIKERVARRAEELGEGRWVIGRGWDQEKLIEKRYPNRWDLDEAAPNNPVFLIRVCGHVAVANSAALERASISKDTPDPPGGIIDRDDSGEPTGVVREKAVQLVREAIPSPSPSEYEQALERGMQECVSHGVTCVHMVSAIPEEFRALQRLRSKGRMKVRVRVFFDMKYLSELVSLGITRGFGDDWLRVNGVKLFIDGSLGGRTAALRGDYSDMPGNRGKVVMEYDKLLEVVREAVEHGLQVAVHGIGDRGIELILRAYREVSEGVDTSRLRWRVEHASILPPDLLEEMRRLDVMAAVQPRFIISDFWAVDRVGLERARYVYNFRSMLERGIIVGGGSDSPVDPLDPLYSMYSAMTRGKYEGIELSKYTMDEALGFMDALRLFTVNSAYLGFDEDVLGSISVGKWADMVVLDRDIGNDDPKSIRDARVALTIVGGEVVYDSGIIKFG